MDHTIAQWVHVSAVTTAQLAGSTRHPNDDVDACSPFSISPRRPGQCQTSTRDFTSDGGESSCQINEADSSLIDDEEANSFESPGPDDIDEPWPYTFRVNAIHSLQEMDADNRFRGEMMYGYEPRKGTGIRAKCPAIMSNEGRLDRYWFSLHSMVWYTKYRCCFL